MADHLGGGVTVGGRVDLVQAMSQHADGVVALLEGMTVGADVYAVGQSADDEHLWTELSQVAEEASHEVLTIGGAVAGAYDVEDIALIEIGSALIVQDDWSIWTLGQALGVVGVAQCQGADVVLVDELHLSCCPPQGVIPVLHGLAQSGRGVGHGVADVTAVLVDSLGTAHGLIEA